MKHDANIFYQSSCQDIEFNDYLLLGGGTDISPAIYGQENYGYCQSPNVSRDRRNIASIHEAVKIGKPIFGICRGFQLLDAVFGGQLIQHTKGQPSSVSITSLVGNGQFLTIDKNSSCHHQVVNTEFTKGEVLGFSENPILAYFEDNRTEMLEMTPEIIYWPQKKALAVQFHPEWHRPDHKMNQHLRGLVKELLGLDNVL